MLRVTEARKRNRALIGASPGRPPHSLSCEPVSSCFFVFYPPPRHVLFNCCTLFVMRLLRDACFTPAQGLARQTPGIHSRRLTQCPGPWPWGAEQSHLKITSHFNMIRGYGPYFLTSCFYLRAMKCNSSPFWFKYHHKSQ